MVKESVYDRITNAEKEVAKLLKEFGIQWSYEQPLFVRDENKRRRVWAPDFHLKHHGIYIEVCGSNNFDYDYRKNIFEKNGNRVIFLHLYKEKNVWLNHLFEYIKLYEDNKILNMNDYKTFNSNI